MLSEEQVKNIKKQIISQVESNFPEEKKEFARKRIESMSSRELEEFLVKNNLVINNAPRQQNSQEGLQQCVFCSIVSGDIESYKIEENDEAIAVLEINPVSKGHVLVIPKKHSINQTKEQEKDTKKLIKNISNMIKKKFQPKNIMVSKANLFGHETINIIPQFQDEDSNSKRRSATPEELLQLQTLLLEKKKVVSLKQPKKIKIKEEEKVWFPRRIP